MNISKIRNILLAFILAFTSIGALAQWVPEGTTWHVHEDDIYQNFPGNEYIIFTAANATVQGKKCSNISSYGNIDFTMYSEKHKLYVYDEYRKQFQLLFDFNKRDTTYNFIQYGDTEEIHIYARDSININGYYVRRIIYSGWGQQGDEAIEGIGAMSGILPNGGSTPYEQDAPIQKIACVTNDFFGSYPTSATDCDKLVGGIADHITTTPVLSAYPNPASSSLNIEITGLHRNAMLQMYNMSGAKVYECTVSATPVQKLTKSIAVDNLPSGIYAIVLQQGQQLTTMKVAVK